jgi:hypothetical protein
MSSSPPFICEERVGERTRAVARRECVVPGQVGGFPRGSAWIGSGPSGSPLLSNAYFFTNEI